MLKKVTAGESLTTIVNRGLSVSLSPCITSVQKAAIIAAHEETYPPSLYRWITFVLLLRETEVIGTQSVPRLGLENCNNRFTI